MKKPRFVHFRSQTIYREEPIPDREMGEEHNFFRHFVSFFVRICIEISQNLSAVFA